MYAAGIRLPPYLTCAGSRPTVWSWSLKEYLAPAATPLLPPSAGASPVPGSGMVTSPCYVIVMMLCCLLCQGVITISVRMCVQMLPGSFCIHDAGDCGVRGHILSRLPQFWHLPYDTKYSPKFHNIHIHIIRRMSHFLVLSTKRKRSKVPFPNIVLIDVLCTSPPYQCQNCGTLILISAAYLLATRHFYPSFDTALFEYPHLNTILIG